MDITYFLFFFSGYSCRWIRNFFMEDFSASCSEMGELLNQVEPSMVYMYTLYTSGILYSISIVGLLLFAIDVNGKWFSLVPFVIQFKNESNEILSLIHFFPCAISPDKYWMLLHQYNLWYTSLRLNEIAFQI